MIDAKYYNKVPFDHHRSIERLENSARQGCHLCTLIASALKLAGLDASNRTGQPGPVQLTWTLKRNQRYGNFHEFLDIRYNGAFAYLHMSDAQPNLNFLENHESIFQPALIDDDLFPYDLSSVLSPAGKASLSGFPKTMVLRGRTYYRIEQKDLGEVRSCGV
jgi:hypothetical protein